MALKIFMAFWVKERLSKNGNKSKRRELPYQDHSQRLKIFPWPLTSPSTTDICLHYNSLIPPAFTSTPNIPHPNLPSTIHTNRNLILIHPNPMTTPKSYDHTHSNLPRCYHQLPQSTPTPTSPPRLYNHYPISPTPTYPNMMQPHSPTHHHQQPISTRPIPTRTLTKLHLHLCNPHPNPFTPIPPALSPTI